MENWYNFDNIKALFKNFLVAGNVKKITVKNYLSDLRHFLGWLIFKLKVENSYFKFKEDSSPVNILPQITSETVQDYKSYLIENNLPLKTINRRLSTLRKFFSFCIFQGWIKENPAKKISNYSFSTTENLLSEFKKDLIKENLNQPTIKSYLKTIREFLSL